jgi:hypothetical protein
LLIFLNKPAGFSYNRLKFYRKKPAGSSPGLKIKVDKFDNKYAWDNASSKQWKKNLKHLSFDMKENSNI